MKGDAEVFPIEERIVSLVRGGVGQHGVCLATVSHQACRLVERLVDVVLKPGEQESLSLLIKCDFIVCTCAT